MNLSELQLPCRMNIFTVFFSFYSELYQKLFTISVNLITGSYTTYVI